MELSLAPEKVREVVDHLEKMRDTLKVATSPNRDELTVESFSEALQHVEAALSLLNNE